MSNPKRTHIEVRDVTGHTWIGDEDTAGEVTPEVYEQITDLLTNFSELNYLSLEIDGRKHYLNPANIVAVTIVGGPA